MRLTLVLGGARSGKTRWAVEWAEARGGSDVSYIATAVDTPDDPELARRIARHRRDRPPAWQTVEEPRDPVRALAGARHRVVVLDCLTLLLSNRLMEDAPMDVVSLDGDSMDAASSDAALEAAVERQGRELVESLLAAASSRTGTLVVVSNEVGQGVVPAHPLGRWFRDAQGRANQALAAASERAVLMVAGLPVYLKGEP